MRTGLDGQVCPAATPLKAAMPSAMAAATDLYEASFTAGLLLLDMEGFA
jgi:hypothetical protein